jgi:cyclophilin family peptidyl-prolyl cis-trans isomerase
MRFWPVFDTLIFHVHPMTFHPPMSFAYLTLIVFSGSALMACGSGSSTAAVTSVTADTPIVGKLTTFTVSGANLPSTTAVSASGCTGVSTLSAGTSSAKQFTCTPTAATVAVSVDYSGSSAFASNVDVQAITGISASTGAGFNKLSTFTITGKLLPTTVTPTVTGCTGLTLVASTSATSRQFICTPDGLSVAVSVAFGALSPYSASVAMALPQVTLVTSLGTVVVELYPDKAPVTVKNFLGYVDSSFYNNTIFHRVVAGFVTQGGGFITDPATTLAQKANAVAAIVLESDKGLSNLKYTLAMARQTGPNTATSQFYFNAANNTSLDYNAATAPSGYAVFGKAITGTAVLDAMNAVANGTVSGYTNVPTTALVLQSATRTQ